MMGVVRALCAKISSKPNLLEERLLDQVYIPPPLLGVIHVAYPNR